MFILHYFLFIGMNSHVYYYQSSRHLIPTYHKIKYIVTYIMTHVIVSLNTESNVDHILTITYYRPYMSRYPLCLCYQNDTTKAAQAMR
jgi:hypothetical protein